MLAITRIIAKRASSQAAEPFPHVIWYLCQIDIIALLSGSGKGEFITAMLQHDLVPSARQLQDCPGFFLQGSLFPDDWDLLGPALDFYREISSHAASIGSLARQFREAVSRHPEILTHARNIAWKQQATGFREHLNQAWNTRMPASVAAGWQNSSLPLSARDMFERVSHLLSS